MNFMIVDADREEYKITVIQSDIGAYQEISHKGEYEVSKLAENIILEALLNKIKVIYSKGGHGLNINLSDQLEAYNVIEIKGLYNSNYILDKDRFQ